MRMETPASARVSPNLVCTSAFLSVLCQEFKITNELSSPETIFFKYLNLVKLQTSVL